jgi:hypothetical protein
MMKGQSDGKKGVGIWSRTRDYAQDHGAAKNSSDSRPLKKVKTWKEYNIRDRDRGEVKDKREANVGRAGVQRRNGSVVT